MFGPPIYAAYNHNPNSYPNLGGVAAHIQIFTVEAISTFLTIYFFYPTPALNNMPLLMSPICYYYSN